jgi:hypothetical protein
MLLMLDAGVDLCSLIAPHPTSSSFTVPHNVPSSAITDGISITDEFTFQPSDYGWDDRTLSPTPV